MRSGFGLAHRDTKFREFFVNNGVNCVRLPARSPNLTPHIERFMRTAKDECLSRVIFFGENSLRNAIKEFIMKNGTIKAWQTS